MKKSKLITNEEGMEEIIRSYFTQLCANKTDSVNEMEEYLQQHKLPRLTE